MHDTRIELNDGRVYIGPLWAFRPTEGWCSLVLDPIHYDDPPPDRFFFRDMISMVTRDQRISIEVTSDQDELERARNQGWNGS